MNRPQNSFWTLPWLPKIDHLGLKKGQNNPDLGQKQKLQLKEIKNKFYSVERMRRHLYSFNSCVLYTWVSLEALNNLYELPIYKPNSPSLWFDL